jgi:hypothetical protein
MHQVRSGRAGGAWALLALAITGCQRSSLPPAVDTKQAGEALRAALETWKEGKPAAALKERSPPVDFRDTHWEQGERLKDFAVQQVETSGQSARFTVKLVLTSEAGQARERVVIYNADAGRSIIIRPNF